MINLNLITLCSFVGCLILGLMVYTAQDMHAKRPKGRIRTRMVNSFSVQGDLAMNAANFDANLFKVSRREDFFSRWFGPKISRLKTVAGARGIQTVISAALVGELVALAMTHFMPLPSFIKPLLLAGLPLLFMQKAYRILVERFRRRFLDGFPDVIDLIVRAVRSGVPVTHVISSAVDECREPLRGEFKLMGDALQLGIDLAEVLAVAIRRIEIADFSFFCVCLLLQRETGGQLGETLENLAGIVRTRREIRHKTKALTGEARITTKILAAIPFVIMLSLYATNRPYVMVLFDTAAGHKLLTFASISVVIGIMIINKMAKLDTSR